MEVVRAVFPLRLPLLCATRSITGMRLSRLSFLAVAAVSLLTPSTLLAAPIEAVGEAVVGEKDARSTALKRAREAAMQVALEQIENAVDETAAKQVMSKVELWTSSYRILERTEVDGQLRLQVEFQIDLPRLAKRLATQGAPLRRGYQVKAVELGESCPEQLGEPSELAEALI